MNGVASTANSGPRRDVYLIILDEYANSSVLRERFGFDNRQFETACGCTCRWSRLRICSSKPTRHFLRGRSPHDGDKGSLPPLTDGAPGHPSAVAHAGSWRSQEKLVRCYQQPDGATMLTVILGGVKLRKKRREVSQLVVIAS